MPKNLLKFRLPLYANSSKSSWNYISTSPYQRMPSLNKSPPSDSFPPIRGFIKYPVRFNDCLHNICTSTSNTAGSARQTKANYANITWRHPENFLYDIIDVIGEVTDEKNSRNLPIPLVRCIRAFCCRPEICCFYYTAYHPSPVY